MMKKIFNFVYSGICLLLLVYLLLPSPSMPGSLPDSVKSNEPGDMEDPMRIAFYTDMNRQEVGRVWKWITRVKTKRLPS